MTRLAQTARVLEAVQSDMVLTEDRAVKAWIAVDRLTVCPTGCLAMNRRALIEMRDKLDAMLAATKGAAS